jgi:quercetin dioxygenase-like cupin family protein
MTRPEKNYGYTRIVVQGCNVEIGTVESVAPACWPFLKVPTTETTLAYMGSLLCFLASADQTGGGLSMLVAHARRGGEPPAHVHHREHELYYILEGEIDFFCEGAVDAFRARPGDAVFLPQGKAHALSFGTSEVRILIVLHATGSLPVGTEPYLIKMATGPATSLKLPENATQYATATSEHIQNATQLAATFGVSLLSPEEAAQRLPLFAGIIADR